MHLTKGYSEVLDVEVWRLQQFVEGKWWQISFTVFPIHYYNGYGRDFIASRTRDHRKQLRFAIANHLKEKTCVS